MQNMTQTTGKTTLGSPNQQAYLKLLQAFPPRPMASEEDYQATRAIIMIEEDNPISLTPKRTTPAHLIGKGKTLGDIVSPIVDSEDWECLK